LLDSLMQGGQNRD